MPTWSHLPRPEDTPVAQEIPRGLEGLCRGWGQRSSMRTEEVPSVLITREVRRVPEPRVGVGEGAWHTFPLLSPPASGAVCPPQQLSGCCSRYCLPAHGICFPWACDPGGEGGGSSVLRHACPPAALDHAEQPRYSGRRAWISRKQSPWAPLGSAFHTGLLPADVTRG